MNYPIIEKYVFELLKNGLSDSLHYHGLHHTVEVIENSVEIAKHEGVSGNDLNLLKLAALFHDIGFLDLYGGHEEISCQMAKEILPNYNISNNEIDVICGMIMATKIPQKPKTLLEKILADADLLYLGTDEFLKIGNTLFKELLENDKIKDERAWNKVQESFLKKHHFHTNYCKANYSKLKEKNLTKVVEWLN